MSRRYHIRPSELIGLEDRYAAYCMDEAMADFAGRLEAGQQMRSEKTKDNRALIDRIMGGKQND